MAAAADPANDNEVGASGAEDELIEEEEVGSGDDYEESPRKRQRRPAETGVSA